MKSRKRRSKLDLGMRLAILAFVGYCVWSSMYYGAVEARELSCSMRLRRMASAAQLYAQDYDDRFPPADRWMDCLQPLVAAMPADGKNDRFHFTDDTLFVCPDMNNKMPPPYGYAFNDALSSRKRSSLAAPAETPMIYETVSLFRNAHGPFHLSLLPRRHVEYYAAFTFMVNADGHIKVRR